MLPGLTDTLLQNLFFLPQELQLQISPQVQTLLRASAQVHIQVLAGYSYIEDTSQEWITPEHRMEIQHRYFNNFRL